MDMTRDNQPLVLEDGLQAALDDSPTIPLAVLPDVGPAEHADSLDAFKLPKTARGEETLQGLAIKNAFPWLIQDAIDMGAVDAGTKAREARLALSDEPCSPKSSPGGAWRPIANRRLSHSNNDLPRISTLPTTSGQRRPPPVTHKTAPSALPSQAGYFLAASSSAPSRERVDRAPPRSTSSTQSHYLSTRLAPLFKSLTGRHQSPPDSPISLFTPYHLTPLHSIPETPKDLDVPPEGSWALRESKRGKALGRSRSQPGVRRGVMGEVPKGQLRRTKSASGAKVAGPLGARARDVSASSQTKVLRPHTIETASTTPDASERATPSQERVVADVDVAKKLVGASSTPTKEAAPSGMKRSPRIQSFVRSKASKARSSLGQLDLRTSLLVRPKRSASAPTPPPLEISHPQVLPSGPPPPRPSRSEPYIPYLGAAPEQEVEDVFYTPQPTPTLTPDTGMPSPVLDLVEEAEERALARKAIAEAEKWLWPTPPPRLAPATARTPASAVEPIVIVVDDVDDDAEGEGASDTAPDDVSSVQTPRSASAGSVSSRRYGVVEWMDVGKLEDALDAGKVAGEWRMKADAAGRSVESLDIMETLEGGGVDMWDLDL
ncbi:hypothetical protein IAT38_001894 [Cryptococcus sp. DSM 104549]